MASAAVLMNSCEEGAHAAPTLGRKDSTKAWPQEKFCGLWLHQEVTPTEGGPFWLATQPQWEHSHDQKKG
eukprot:2296836-Heterocapsa_arctica.AAC.1